MKKKLKVMAGIVFCMLIGGCALDEGLKDRQVHVETMEEMKTFAKEKLSERYGTPFIIMDEKPEALTYVADEESKHLSGQAYVKGEPDKSCYFRVEAPHTFKDDFATQYYKEEILAAIQPQLEGIEKSSYNIIIDHDLSSKLIDPSKTSYKDYLYDGHCCLCFTAFTEEKEALEQYIPVIREWMNVLYAADYHWYFELRSSEDQEKILFTLDPGDNGFDASEDWEDDYICRCIESNLRNKAWFS